MLGVIIGEKFFYNIGLFFICNDFIFENFIDELKVNVFYLFNVILGIKLRNFLLLIRLIKNY